MVAFPLVDPFHIALRLSIRLPLPQMPVTRKRNDAEA